MKPPTKKQKLAWLSAALSNWIEADYTCVAFLRVSPTAKQWYVSTTLKLMRASKFRRTLEIDDFGRYRDDELFAEDARILWLLLLKHLIQDNVI